MTRMSSEAQVIDLVHERGGKRRPSNLGGGSGVAPVVPWARVVADISGRSAHVHYPPEARSHVRHAPLWRN